jgi:putative intracellular protease/amidase
VRPGRSPEFDQANRSFLAAGKPAAPVCHAPGALRHVKTPAGRPLVEGKNVTGFINGEEPDVGLTKVVPFLVEDDLWLVEIQDGGYPALDRTGGTCDTPVHESKSINGLRSGTGESR